MAKRNNESASGSEKAKVRVLFAEVEGNNQSVQEALRSMVSAMTKIGPAHVMTALKEAGRAIPVDLRQTIRNVKKSKMWLNFADIEDIRTTTQGDNFVEHEMGASE